MVLNPSTTERAIVLIGAGKSSGSDFDAFCKTLTNFCYIEGNQIVVNPGRVGLGGDEQSFWSHEELRFDYPPGGLKIWAWAKSNESNKISYGIGGAAPPYARRKAIRLIFEVTWDADNRKHVLTRYHIGGDIIIDGYMGLSIWKK